MFALKIHSVDTEHPLVLSPSDDTDISTTSATLSNPDTNFFERRGAIHLFRSVSNPSSRSTLLFVVAVPNYMSPGKFIHFCGSLIDSISELMIIRNDAMEDRYSVLIRLNSQLKADGFYCSFNGKNFSPGKAEVCHILFTLSVDYTELAQNASTHPPGYTELPTCPVCLERLDQDISGILSTLCDHSFQCSCISKWTHLSCQVCRYCQKQEEKPTCFICGTLENIWICMICGFIGCGRYKEGHAIKHWRNTEHCYSLDLETQRVWDYVGDTYVHRLNQSKTQGKMEMTNSSCMSLEGDCGTCEDSGISGALFDSKLETIVDEYNRLLATQLETQRQYYEAQLFEAKSKREKSVSESVEKALISKMQEIQDKLEKRLQEKKSVAEINQKLINKQEDLRKKLKEIEEREISLLRSREEQITDLEEQIRDLTVYIEAQKTLGGMAESDDIREGTVLPVAMKQNSPVSTKRNTKSSRRKN